MAKKHAKRRRTKPVDVSKHTAWWRIRHIAHVDEIKKHYAVLLITIGLGLMLVGLGLSQRTETTPQRTALPTIPKLETPELPPETEPSILSGLPVDPDTVNDPITAVMIENSTDARPQSGLERSAMVFEAIAEGGITRFMVVFQHEQPENLGPIRSARPYYVRWAAGLDAQFLHSGGSPEALGLIPSLGIKDLDHGRYGDSLASRVSTRFAPHNVYTNPGKVASVADNAGFGATEYTGLERKEPSAAVNPNAVSIFMDISGFNYNTSYAYRAEQNDYLRTMAGSPHTDAESGTQISPEVVIAMEMSYGIHPNGIHSVYGSIGSGKATIFQDGNVTKGFWSKPSDTAKLTFIDADDDPIPLNPGQIWLTALQSGQLRYE